jgi:hypothetical protein
MGSGPAPARRRRTLRGAQARHGRNAAGRTPYAQLAVAYALDGKLAEAKAALAEARRVNPKLTVKLVHDRLPEFPWMSEGLRKAGLQEE